MSSINTVIQTLNKSIDNGSILYVMKTGRSIAFDRERLFLKWDSQNGDARSLYADVVSPRLVREPALITLYKTTNGVWINLTKLFQNNIAMGDPISLAEMQNFQRDPYLFPILQIPECEYTSNDGHVYTIAQGDGATPVGYRSPVEIDENSSDELVVEQFSIDDPLLSFTLRHLMQDLKINLKKHRWDEVLFWLNGSFVPITGDVADPHKFYVRDGKSYVDSRVVDQREATVRNSGSLVNFDLTKSKHARMPYTNYWMHYVSMLVDDTGLVWYSGARELSSGGLIGHGMGFTAWISGVAKVIHDSLTAFFLMKDGRVKVYGHSGPHFGMGVDVALPPVVGDPIYIRGLTDVVDIQYINRDTFSGTSIFVYFLKRDGTVYGCGNNIDSNGGFGDTLNRYSPTILPELSDIVNISIGRYNAFFVKKDGSVYGCGRNYSYSLGIGTKGSLTANPTIIPQLIDVKAAHSTDYGTFFLMKDGTVKALGYDWTKVPAGSTNPASSTVTNVAPTTMEGLSDIESIYPSLAANNLILLKSDKSVWLFGANSDFPNFATDVFNTSPILLKLMKIRSLYCGYGITIFESLATRRLTATGLMRIPDASNGSYYWDNYAGVNTQLIIGDGRFDLPVLSPHTLNSATIDEDPSNDYYRYNFNTRVFKWKNIKLSNWIRPAFVKGYPIEIDVNNYVVVPQTLTFPEIINSGAHFIIRDGRLLSPDEYEIDPTNPRVVFLKQIAYDADAYLRDRIKAGVYNPLEYVREKFSNSQHYLVNISSTTTTPVKIMRTHSCMPNFPYKDEITFSDFSIYDTLLIDGKFIPTEWIHNNTVRIPMSVSNTLFKDRSVLSDADIYKLTFVDA